MLLKVICCFVFLVVQANVIWMLEEGNTVLRKWPPRVTKNCTQKTKQKAMYGHMKFSPSLKEKEMIKMNVQVEWNDLQFAPYNTKKKGAVFVSYMTKSKGGPGGYFGVQLRGHGGGQHIFSIWDADRWTKDKPRRPKPCSKLTWPLNMHRCKRNCQDCGKKMAFWHKKGLTTGTQCKLRLLDMKKGDHFDIQLERTERQLTINTKDYGGMPKGHAIFGEFDRNVTGGVWIMKARNLKTNKTMEVGKILFEGDGSGMGRLSTFDEMIGCNGCNMIYHRDTRYGPFIHDGDGKIRKPIEMRGTTKWWGSICKQYCVSGSKNDTSISFESGPLTSKLCDGKSHKIW